jgi:NitT/TauT family transport system permease protein
MKALKRILSSNIAVPIITIGGLIIIWEVAARAFNIASWLLPAPSEIFLVFLERPDIWKHTWVTLLETLGGFGLSILFGIPLAVLIMSSPVLRNAIYPLLLITQSIPKIAIAPLLLVWIGYGASTKIVLAFLVAFFPIVVDTATGLNSPPAQLLDLAKQLSASRLQVFTKIRFPSAMPHIFSGLKVAISLSVIGAVVAEFIASTEGLGYMVLISSAHFKTDAAFAAMIVLSIMGIVLFFILENLEQVLVPWYGSEEEHG